MWACDTRQVLLQGLLMDVLYGNEQMFLKASQSLPLTITVFSGISFML